MSYSFFAYLSRMKEIHRWALMRNNAQESVQEHCHMTAVLAHALAVIRRDVLGKPADPDAAAAAALFHDAPEIFTGDMPTPVKYFNPQLRSAYAMAEDSAAERLLSTLPEQMRDAYEPLVRETSEQTELVKAADKLSAYLKCLEELRSGNEEFRLAARQTKEKLKAMAMPEVDYFLREFAPAFSLTLDELED